VTPLSVYAERLEGRVAGLEPAAEASMPAARDRGCAATSEGHETFHRGRNGTSVGRRLAWVLENRYDVPGSSLGETPSHGLSAI
jgi:hypothetical protein